MDHQLPLSTIYISATVAINQEEAPQCTSGPIINQESSLLSMNSQNHSASISRSLNDIIGGCVGFMWQLLH